MWDFMHGAIDGVPTAGVIYKVNGLRAQIKTRLEIGNGHLSRMPSKALFYDGDVSRERSNAIDIETNSGMIYLRFVSSEADI